MHIAIVTGSTRPGRNNIAVARWVLELAAKRPDAQFELVDIADYERRSWMSQSQRRSAVTAMRIPGAGRRRSRPSMGTCSWRPNTTTGRPPL